MSPARLTESLRSTEVNPALGQVVRARQVANLRAVASPKTRKARIFCEAPASLPRVERIGRGPLRRLSGSGAGFPPRVRRIGRLSANAQEFPNFPNTYAGFSSGRWPNRDTFGKHCTKRTDRNLPEREAAEP